MGEFVGMRLAEARDLAAALEGVARDARERAARVSRLCADLDGGSAGGRLADVGSWAADQANDIRWRADELQALDGANDGYAHATFPWKTFQDFKEDFQQGQFDGKHLTEVLDGPEEGYADVIADLHNRGRAYIEGLFEGMSADAAARLRAAIRSDRKLARSFDAALASYIHNPSHNAAYSDFGAKRDTAVAKTVANDLATELKDPKHMRPSWSEVQRLLNYLRSIKDNPNATASFFNGLGGKGAALLPLFVIAGWAAKGGKRDVAEVEAAIDLVRHDLATASATVGRPGGLKPDVVRAMFAAKLPDAASYKAPPDQQMTAVDINKALQAAGFGQEFVEAAGQVLGAEGVAIGAHLFGGIIMSAGVLDAIAIGVENGFDSPQFVSAGVQAGLDVAAFAIDGPVGALLIGVSIFIGLLSTIGPCDDCPKPAMEYGTDARPPGDPHYINSAGFAPDPQHVSS